MAKLHSYRFINRFQEGKLKDFLLLLLLLLSLLLFLALFIRFRLGKIGKKLHKETLVLNCCLRLCFSHPLSVCQVFPNVFNVTDFFNWSFPDCSCSQSSTSASSHDSSSTKSKPKKRSYSPTLLLLKDLNPHLRTYIQEEIALLNYLKYWSWQIWANNGVA